MKVTVCQLDSRPHRLAEGWAGLVAHVQRAQSDLVLLPEMVFSEWLAASRVVDVRAWETAVSTHDQWLTRLPELGSATVLGSRPVIEEGRHHNRAFIWEPETGLRLAHTKYYLPNETHFWEAEWYERGDGKFTAVSTQKASVGFMLCTDLWFTQHARAYGQAGAHIIASPRATERVTRADWIAGGKTVAIVSGAYCLSSNHVSPKMPNGLELGGMGWIIDPDGKLLGKTSDENPFLTLEIDLQLAEQAKKTYPRYVRA